MDKEIGKQNQTSSENHGVNRLSEWVELESEKRGVPKRDIIDELFTSYHTISDLGDIISEPESIEEESETIDEPNENIDNEKLDNLINLLSNLSVQNGEKGDIENLVNSSQSERSANDKREQRREVQQSEDLKPESEGDVSDWEYGNPSTDSRNDIDQQLEKIYKQFDGIDSKFEELEHKITWVEDMVKTEAGNAHQRTKRLETKLQKQNELMELKNKTLAKDVDVATCSSCDNEIEMFSLTECECPECGCVIVDVEMSSRWNPFDSHTIRVVNENKFQFDD